MLTRNIGKAGMENAEVWFRHAPYPGKTLEGSTSLAWWQMLVWVHESINVHACHLSVGRVGLP